MIDVLYKYFERSFPLAEKDKMLIQSVVLPRKILKGEFLVQAGEVARYGAFVTKGFLRSYVVDEKGKEPSLEKCLWRLCVNSVRGNDLTAVSVGGSKNLDFDGWPLRYLKNA